MKIITIYLPDIYIETIQKFIDKKPDLFPNRSALLRKALEEFLILEIDFQRILSG